MRTHCGPNVTSLLWVTLLKLCLPGNLNNECPGFLVHSFNCVSNHASTHFTIQVWLSYCEYEPHSHYAIRAYRPNIFALIYQNTTNCNSYFTHYCQNMLQTNMPLKCHMCATCTAIINVTKRIGIYTFYITGLC